MKFLENSKLEALNSALMIENGDCCVIGRVESYSCKMAGDDKRLFKTLSHEGDPNELTVLSPPQTVASVSPAGYSTSADENENPLNYACSRKTLYYLISTLNASFRPDYDFSNAKSDEFSREPSVNFVTNFINSSLGAVLGERYNRGHWVGAVAAECLAQERNESIDSWPILTTKPPQTMYLYNIIICRL
uniref:repressor of RNA polymerase III transcription MAF1 homolog isoform X2 n=1 Tax=Ciona intestinalis TaxID=7719 RepID=UPI000EF52B27|nr:repressor of RNA polymerase III transcription MAF1 homolog isoform X2 [Ciona intestinalis]|eukprot:XP_026694270.1 repressor of RNA polymerase III transcription MAF1 homolog isoform X2 [Ciona intestinalis]